MFVRRVIWENTIQLVSHIIVACMYVRLSISRLDDCIGWCSDVQYVYEGMNSIVLSQEVIYCNKTPCRDVRTQDILCLTNTKTDGQERNWKWNRLQIRDSCHIFPKIHRLAVSRRTIPFQSVTGVVSLCACTLAAVRNLWSWLGGLVICIVVCLSSARTSLVVRMRRRFGGLYICVKNVSPDFYYLKYGFGGLYIGYKKCLSGLLLLKVWVWWIVHRC